MFDYIKGLFTYKIANSKGCFATVETGGVGYSFEIMERDFASLSDENKDSLCFAVKKISLSCKRIGIDLFNHLTDSHPYR